MRNKIWFLMNGYPMNSIRIPYGTTGTPEQSYRQEKEFARARRWGHKSNVLGLREWTYHPFYPGMQVLCENNKWKLSRYERYDRYEVLDD